MTIGEKGFSILEVLIGMAIFMIGMMGIAMLLISTIKAEAYSSRLNEATMLARSTFEELMSTPYDNSPANDGTRPLDDINNADDDAEYVDPAKFNGTDTSGLGFNKNTVDPTDATRIEYIKTNMGSNGRFTVFYNVCEDACLMQDTKAVRVFVRWKDKDVDRTIDFFGAIPRT